MLGAAGLYYHNLVVSSVESKYQKQALVLTAKKDKLQDELDNALREKQKEILTLRRQSDAKIYKLLQENKTLKDWWETHIPPDGRDFAYGLSNKSP